MGVEACKGCGAMVRVTSVSEAVHAPNCRFEGKRKPTFREIAQAILRNDRSWLKGTTAE